MWTILAAFACLLGRVQTLTFVWALALALILDLTDFPSSFATLLPRRKDRS